MSSRLPPWRGAHRYQARQIARLHTRYREMSRSQSIIARSALNTNYQARAEKGQANGYAPLDASGNIPESYLPYIPSLEGDYALRQEVPSNEELILGPTALLWSDETTTVDPGQNLTAFVGSTPFAMFLHSLDLVFDRDVPASTTNFWTLTLRWFTGGTHAAGNTNTFVVSRSTATNPITRGQPWGFGAQVWTEAARSVPIGAALRISADGTGTPPAPLRTGVATIRYGPL